MSSFCLSAMILGVGSYLGPVVRRAYQEPSLAAVAHIRRWMKDCRRHRGRDGTSFSRLEEYLFAP